MSRALPVLGPRFEAPETFRTCDPSYSLLPFKFISLVGDRYVLTNFAGEHLVLPRNTLTRFIRHELAPDEPAYRELEARHFLTTASSTLALELLATKYRTKHARLADFTSLFMFVVTLRCEHSCRYCQVSRQSEDRVAFDMSEDTARRAVDFMFQSPSRHLKVEFQGGEPLLAFDRVRQIVELAVARNVDEKRNLDFVIATNLALITDEHLEYCQRHGIVISTSLDGPSDLHDANRPRPGRDAHARTVLGIERARGALGHDRVSALMTTSPASLDRPEAIVDEYVRLGFDSIFLRPLSPYGFAERSGLVDHYGVGEWLQFYWAALRRIIDWNVRGTFLREEYAAIILRKILTPFATGFVDLQSPAGIGIAALVFNYDGSVFASDESRMLAEMGDTTFRLGSLAAQSFDEIMSSDALLEPLATSMSECVPACADCGVQPYCGSDPVYHHATQGDFVGRKTTSDFCRRNMSLILGIIQRLEDDPEASRVFRSWIR